MDLIQLDISALKQSDSQNNSYVLLLNEIDGNRQLPIVIGWPEARSIALALEDSENLERPLTHDLFVSIGDRFNISVSKVIIHTLNEGIFHSSFFCNMGKKEQEIDARTSDAVAIAVRFKCPIFTYESVLGKAGIILEKTLEDDLILSDDKKEVKAKEKGLSDFSKRKLQQLLKKAIEAEDYEKAAAIRDEINKRKEK